MRIGMIIGRIGGLDGVALEAEKWLAVLGGMGHELFVLSGEFEGRAVDPESEDRFPPLSFYSPECGFEQKHAFFGGEASEDELLGRIDATATRIEERIVEWAGARKLEVLLAENACALPFHLSMGLGIRRAVARLGLPTIAHDHDFTWERESRYTSPREGINRLVTETFPTCLPHVHHAVINSAAHRELQGRFGIDAAVIPNVMDFERPFGRPDEFNRTLRRDMGLDEDDRLLFQVTRILRRKAIETAIRLVYELDDPRVKLIITGSPSDDPGGAYAEELRKLVQRLRVTSKVFFAHRFFAHERALTGVGNRIYGLGDAYANADACTFFSTYEGFGNAFVECVLARKPIFVNNYEPVYESDIGSLGFRTVLLQNGALTAAAVEEIREILRRPETAREIAEHNFELGRRHFSFDVLRERLDSLLSGL